MYCIVYYTTSLFKDYVKLYFQHKVIYKKKWINKQNIKKSLSMFIVYTKLSEKNTKYKKNILEKKLKFNLKDEK